ncbi:unnamed protein product [Heterotrigona itama]|uniref:Uncharacterized protein n=1 Tax=Heterotrigona itama TaxID=395501 RepID=A0A6V7H925_9HYME|nr:unnamed protein product [Heterotrigona itama]
MVIHMGLRYERSMQLVSSLMPRRARFMADNRSTMQATQLLSLSNRPIPLSNDSNRSSLLTLERDLQLQRLTQFHLSEISKLFATFLIVTPSTALISPLY